MFDRQPTLEGDLVRIRPIERSDFPPLIEIASDPLVWEQHPSKDRADPVVFGRFLDATLDSGGGLVVIDRHTGETMGTTRFDRYDADKSEVEIGWTMLARSRWGGTYNGEMKRLMLDHAARFVRTVTFTVHSHNYRSQRAVEKLGGVRVRTEIDELGRGENVIFHVTLPPR